MTGRIYTVSFTGVTVTLADDLFEITPADDKPCQIIGLFIGQSSDPGDAQAEQTGYRIIRGHTTSGSGGTSTTPVRSGGSGAAAGFTAETCNTTPASGGTTVDLHAGVINWQAGEYLWLPEGCEWGASQADTTLVVRLIAAPADSLTVSGTLYVRELG